MKIEGNKLVPDLKKRSKDLMSEGAYWLGARDSLPTAGCHVSGVTFAHVVTVQAEDGMGGNIESSYMGCIRSLTKAQVKAIAAALPYLVVRFTSTGAQSIPLTTDLDGDGKEVQTKPVRRGYIIQIPRGDDVESKRFQTYTPMDSDEPLADHIYMVKANARGAALPEPLSKTGIEE